MCRLKVFQHGIRYFIVLSLTLVLTVTFTLSAPTLAFATELSKSHAAFFDPNTQKLVGEKIAEGVATFFHDAEMAIETENIDGLMSLYSDSYVNGPHTKQSMRLIWLQLFKKYRELITVHNMRFITLNPNSVVVVIRCSGLLMGSPEEEDGLLPLDSWNDSDHILANENGVWRLIGNAGKQKKRLWFSVPMHTLF